MPKLPSFFDQPKPEQSKKDHQGRVRTVPHQHDSWATYVYCKVDLSVEVQKLLPHLKQAELLPEHHISLSRPVYLRRYQVSPFKADIKASLRNSSRFDLSFAQIAHLTNDEKTRSFLTLEIGHGYNQLFECMTCIDKVMKNYHKPTFYDPPRFHASIAWSLKDSTVKSIHIPPEMIEELAKDVFNIDKVYIKMGNILETVSLN
ncbi:U6 snRNA phosphodiesterase Usb1 [Parasitella parasitica]|nr:U6 snRNA phosphodiesterase Usb1 [Parasitella parasitica]